MLAGRRPVLPGSTRWNSQIDMLKNYEENHARYLQIIRKEGCKMEQDSDVLETLNDGHVFGEVSRLIVKLQPIASALNELQADSASYADAMHHWLKLKQELEFTDVDEKQAFKKRFKMAINDAGICAYMLHPKYKGSKLKLSYLERGREWLKELNPYFVVIFASLQSEDENYFPKTMLSDDIILSMDAISWWKAVSKSSTRIPPGFLNLVDSLLRLPASTSGLERTLSTMGRIMCKERANLGIEMAEKLCYVSFHSKSN